MKCPLCKKSVSKKFLMEYKGFKLYKCKSCKNGFWYPLKSTPGDWYANAENEENDILSYTYGKLHSTEHFISPQQEHFFKNIPVKGGELLDVGSGNGSFIKEASKMFLAYGIDYDLKSVEAANKKGLKNVILADVFKFAKRTNKRFNVVTFYEVLEHQANPNAFINSIKRLLKKGGYIAGSVPSHKEIKPFGKGDVPPNHFLIFTKEGLKKYLKLKGFKSVKVEEVAGVDNVRASLGLNSDTLRLFLSMSHDEKRNTLKYFLYKTLKNIGRLILPLINFFISIYLRIIGKKKEKEIKDRLTISGLYFQARL